MDPGRPSKSAGLTAVVDHDKNMHSLPREACGFLVVLYLFTAWPRIAAGHPRLPAIPARSAPLPLCSLRRD